MYNMDQIADMECAPLINVLNDEENCFVQIQQANEHKAITLNDEEAWID